MKWLVIIVILILIAVGMLWLRTVRQGPNTVRSRDPHRLDDSVIPPTSPGLRPDMPSTTTAAGAGAEGGREATEEPRSDVTPDPGITSSEEPGRPDDLPPSETRPRA
jgi:hypothetical protein